MQGPGSEGKSSSNFGFIEGLDVFTYFGTFFLWSSERRHCGTLEAPNRNLLTSLAAARKTPHRTLPSLHQACIQASYQRAPAAPRAQFVYITARNSRID